jgi:hypothetical protein
MHVRIHPELIDDLNPSPAVVIAPDARERLLEHLEHEMETVFAILNELAGEGKITAADIRLVLSLRGINLCM